MAETAMPSPINSDRPNDCVSVQGNGSVAVSNIIVLHSNAVPGPCKFEGYCISENETDNSKDDATVRLEKIQTSMTAPSNVLSQVSFETLPHHLSVPPIDGANNLHFIISTLAGTRKAQTFFDRVVEPLISSVGIQDYDIHATSSEHTISELTRSIFLPRANQRIEQTIVLLSGDGGLVDIINVMILKGMDSNAIIPSISLLPMGTGNALAHSSGLTNDSTFGLRKMLKGTPKPLPMFQAEFSQGAQLVTNEGQTKTPLDIPKNSSITLPALSGAVVCSWGLHASLVADSDTAEYRKHGADRFAMAAKELLHPADGSESHHYRARITIDTETERGERARHQLERIEHMYILATLVSELQQGFRISPKSEPLDGQLRLVHFGYMEPVEAMRILGLAYQGGQHVSDKAVSYETINSIRIDFDELDERWRRVCVDGKIVSVEEGGWIQVGKVVRSCVNLVA